MPKKLYRTLTWMRSSRVLFHDVKYRENNIDTMSSLITYSRLIVLAIQDDIQGVGIVRYTKYTIFIHVYLGVIMYIPVLGTISLREVYLPQTALVFSRVYTYTIIPHSKSHHVVCCYHGWLVHDVYLSVRVGSLIYDIVYIYIYGAGFSSSLGSIDHYCVVLPSHYYVRSSPPPLVEQWWTWLDLAPHPWWGLREDSQHFYPSNFD